MLYKHNQASQLSNELFENPTSEYRGVPFWSWNTKLKKETLLKQVDIFKEMGLGGFHMHCRVGLDTPYLSDEFMDCIKATVEKAKENKMIACLYDEDRWPSGAAGGLVTKDEQYRSRYLVFTPFKTEDKEVDREKIVISSMKSASQGTGRLLACYGVTLKDGCLEHYRMLSDESQAEEGEAVWYAYLEISPKSPWYNNQTYVDTLNKKAIERFIEVTHEKYYQTVGDEFDGVIPSIFTDEPQFAHKTTLNFAEEQAEVIIPYTDGFDEFYEKCYGEAFLPHLPEIFWELPDQKVSQHRYRYHDCIAELFASSFADTLGDWCRKHNIMLTGHMMEEPTLQSQTVALGEAMRSYRGFDLPGIDMLCDRYEYSTAKQAQSASHQFGCPGVMSELYGVTNWDFDFRGHKLQGDWQAALGVTMRVPHLSWMSMGGEAKRDYPASIFYQSPWYKEYPLVENHFARLNTAMTRGQAKVQVGVIHPVESYWLHFGSKEQTDSVRAEMDQNFENIIEWLLFSQIDFDFIAESLLPIQNQPEEKDTLSVGKMNYKAVVVPSCETIRRTTLERLKAFRKGGGMVLFAGDVPTLVDAIPSEEVKEFAKECVTVPFIKTRVVAALAPYRDLTMKNGDGTDADNLLYQMRKDGDSQWLFIANGKPVLNKDVPHRQDLRIQIAGEWDVTLYDTLTGKISPLSVSWEKGKTLLNTSRYEEDSMLLKLSPKTEAVAEKQTQTADQAASRIGFRVPVTLTEPNALLLDVAEYRFDNGEWQPLDEVLRIDNKFRELLGYPLRMDALAQPWTETHEVVYDHTLSLRFTVHSEVEATGVCLALEDLAHTTIYVNGEQVEGKADGWYVDEAIQKVHLPDLKPGDTQIVLEIAYGRKSGAEWCYLLGDFGVKVAGVRKTVISPVRELNFGDITTQGLPFYTGNIVYHVETELSDGCELEISKYRGALLSVDLDGKLAGKIVYSPYTLAFHDLTPGMHRLDITLFGTRYNGFGALHNCDECFTWHGPDAWRSKGTSFSYEYQLKKAGILKTPVIKRPAGK